MRSVVIAAALTFIASANAGDSTSLPIDLNSPGAMDQLKIDRPKHLAAIAEVIRVAERLPCQNHEIEAVKARYNITEWGCNFVLLASLPPKRRVFFQLEDAHYVAVVTVKGTEGRVRKVVR